MKHLLVLPMVALVSACASSKGPEHINLKSDSVVRAHLDVRICAVKQGMELLGATQDPARDIARTAVGNCTIHLVNMERVVVAENPGNGWADFMSKEFSKNVRERTVDEVAEVVMKARIDLQKR